MTKTAVEHSNEIREYAKTLRRALRSRTGMDWSVRKLTATGLNGVVEVQAPPSRRVDGETTSADAAILTEAFGCPAVGALIPNRGSVRDAILRNVTDRRNP